MMRVYNQSRFNFKGCRKFQTKKGHTLWLLQDVCRELNIPKNQHKNAYERLLAEERSYFEETTSEGDRRVFFLVNKAGIYSLILQQKGVRAAKFKRWLAHDVIPRIEKKQNLVLF
jgi:prophage antirepressor-like protein